MKYDRLYNFISPKTGKIILPTDYTLVGDNRGFSYSSPILQHIQLDQIKLQKYLDDNTIFIDNTFDIEKRIRLKNLPLLGAAKFPLPDPSFFDSLYGMPLIPDIVVDALKEVINSASSIPIPNPTYDPFNVADWVMNAPFMPQIIAGNPHVRLDGGIDPETIISSTTAFLHIAIAKVKKQLQYGNFIVKKRDISWDWDNIEKINSVTGAFDVLTNRYPTLDTYLTKAKNLFLSLYNLNSDHTFSENTQVLEELLTEHEQTNPNTGAIEKYKKGGVLALNNTADLKLAIPGSDYVDYKTNTFGPLCVIDVLASENSNKFISKSLRSKLEPNNKPINIPLQIQERDKNKQDLEEKDWEVLNIEKINVRHDLSYEELLDESYSDTSRLLAYDYKGKLIPAKIGNEFYTVNNIADILNTVNHISTLLRVVIGVSDAVNFLDITAQQAKNLNKIVKTIGGISDSVNMVDVTVSDASKLTNAVKNAVGVAASEGISEAASKAFDVFTNKAALVEMEAQIAALAGVAEVNTLWNLFNSIGILSTAIGGYHYGQYIRGQSLNVNNTWKSTDLNDECSNATGLLRALTITPYSYENRGHGTLWFDSCGRDPNGFLSDTKNEAKSEAGLRIFSWDSTNDITDITNNPLSPLHIGLFGYRKYYTQADEYKGFIFNVDFDNDKGDSLIPGNITNDNYRFPLKFGLYSVKRKVSSITGGKTYGWKEKDAIFEYDYNSFNFYKPVTIQNLSVTKNLNIPVMKSTDIPSNSTTGAMFFCDDL